jgi:cobalt-zinc-cadmium efflux system outer membrane protein
METTKIAKVLTLALVSLALDSGFARDKAAETYGEVGDQVRQRTGSALRWGKDAVTREQNLQEARKLLKRPLTVQAAVQIALLNNQHLQATLEDVGISLADFREAGYLKNPTIDFTLQFPSGPPAINQLVYGITFDLLDALFIPLRKKLTRKELDATKLRVANEVLQLVADVKSAYYNVVADRQTLDRFLTIQKAFDASLDLAQKQFQAGNSTDVALGLEQINYSQIRLQIAEIRVQDRADSERLTRLLGLWGSDTEWTAEKTLPAVPDTDFPTRGLETLAVSQRFDLASAQQQLYAVVQALGIAKKYRFVSALSIGANGDRAQDNGVNNFGPSLSVQLPIFNQGQAGIARAEAQLRQAERNFESLAIEIRSEVRELRDRLAGRREIAKFYETDILPFRRRVVGGQFLQYNAMIVGPFDLFRTKIDELNAERDAIPAVKEYWVTRAELERAVGGSLSPRTQSGSKQMISNDSKR